MRNIGRLPVSVAALLVVMQPVYALPRDLIGLANFVVPAYTAMNVAVLCAQEDATFLAATAGTRGTAVHYAAHVKNEVIEGLPDSEARLVLRRAADLAREIARAELARISRGGPAQAGVRTWCESTARIFVRSVIGRHDEHHDQWLTAVARARN